MYTEERTNPSVYEMTSKSVGEKIHLISGEKRQLKGMLVTFLLAVFPICFLLYEPGTIVFSLVIFFMFFFILYLMVFKNGLWRAKLIKEGVAYKVADKAVEKVAHGVNSKVLFKDRKINIINRKNGLMDIELEGDVGNLFHDSINPFKALDDGSLPVVFVLYNLPCESEVSQRFINLSKF